jgi:hypothetical protein
MGLYHPDVTISGVDFSEIGDSSADTAGPSNILNPNIEQEGLFVVSGCTFSSNYLPLGSVFTLYQSTSGASFEGFDEEDEDNLNLPHSYFNLEITSSTFSENTVEQTLKLDGNRWLRVNIDDLEFQKNIGSKVNGLWIGGGLYYI